MSVEVDLAALDERELAQLVKRMPAQELRNIMRGPSRRAVLDRVFRDMPRVFRADRAGSTDAVVHWRIGDGPDDAVDTYELVIDGGGCAVSARPEREPRLALSIGVVDFLKVVTGNANAMVLFVRGKMKAKGDLGLATRFPAMFDVPKA
jgi:putative sterol carrier protein